MFTVTNLLGDTFFKKSAGAEDVPKKSKAACRSICYNILLQLQSNSIKRVNLKFRGGFKKWRRTISWYFLKNKIKLLTLSDLTSYPHNGCRKKKLKR
jgi:ribosomal protein S11